MNFRRIVRPLWRVALYGFGAYGLVHFASTTYFAWCGTRIEEVERRASLPVLRSEQQPMVSALTRVLVEDGVREAERWATAIVSASPVSDVGYVALIAAQIRRESAFLVPDLEWLYSRVVPQLVHEFGMPDPVRTVGPMQVQRWRVAEYFQRTVGVALTPDELKQLAYDLEPGVAACVAVLDGIVVDHIPDRRIRGHRDFIGPAGLWVAPRVSLARDFGGHVDGARKQLALHQKLLCDLAPVSLAIDGIEGERTREALNEHPEFAVLTDAMRAFEARFGVRPPDSLPPRITHDPRLAFVFADFNAGEGTCRVAALQALLNQIVGSELACDGKVGPETRRALDRLFETQVSNAQRSAEYRALLASGAKPHWLREQAFEIARRIWRERHDADPPEALVPDLWSDGVAQQVKGLGRVSVEGYVAGSEMFFEDYLRRLSLCLGLDTPPRARAIRSARN